MKSYVVGGAVRDRLLGLPVVDRDHVVVGGTVDEMLAAGFQPVGRDFPVFLHPETHEEYALARTERKVAPGYAGFVFHADPTVTLEADLERRDLTVNAIAEDEATGALIDPFDGRGDLATRLFRHVGPAFAEDPVRLLRVARFAARFTDFAVAPETLDLMRAMTRAGEIDALVPERVWQELARGLMELRPSRMFEVLRETGALARVLPEVAALFENGAVGSGSDTLRFIDRAAAAGSVLEVRFAVLLHRVGPAAGSARPVEILCRRLAVPRAAREVAVLVQQDRDALMAAVSASDGPTRASRLVDVMARGDAFRRGPRFLQAVEAVGYTVDDAGPRSALLDSAAQALAAAITVDGGAIAREVGYDARLIGSRLNAARRAAVEHVLVDAAP